MNPTLLSVSALVPSPTNPRKHFNPAKLADLAANLKLHGVLQPLLVRPLPGGPLQGVTHEIVAGERRHRAAVMAGLPDVPCTVRNLSDVEAFEIQLVENLQRDDLTPTEEAQGFHDALQLRLEGKAVHTVESLAARVGKGEDHIRERMKLLDLAEELRLAVDSGALPPSVASLVARIPSDDQRLEAGKMVLAGHGTGSPLTKEETRELIRTKFMRELKGAPFDQKDPMLLPAAGSCETCPHRSGNIPGFEGKRTDVCTKPPCYVLKADMAFKRAASDATARGLVLLEAAEAAKHFDELGELRHDTPLARIAARPAAHLLKAEVEPAVAPTWAQLIERAHKAKFAVKCYVARNPKTGRVEELVDSREVVAAAEKFGEPIFRTAKSEAPVPVTKRPGEDEDDAFRRGQRELAEKNEKESKAAAEEARVARLVRTRALRAVHAGLVEKWTPADVWGVMLDWLLDGEVLTNFLLVHEVLGMKGAVEAGAARKAVKAQPVAGRQALVPLLMIAGPVMSEGIACRGLRELAKFGGVDLRAIEREVAKEAKAAKPKKGLSAVGDRRSVKAAKKTKMRRAA